jgi:endoglucanase
MARLRSVWRIMIAARIAVAVLTFAFAGRAAAAACGPWPSWETFKSAYVSGDGRVIDPTHEDHRTVSEGQAYAMIFALAANDRASFDRLLTWTTNNLARGDMGLNLPAWLWGHREKDDSWGVIDANPATDADVWLAYALLEAGRLWSEPRYVVLADRMIANIAQYEVRDLPRLGPSLMPAPHGFVHDDYFRLNPSYLAMQPLRRIAAHTRDTLWPAVIASSRRVLLEAAPLGVAGDWVEWHPLNGFLPDAKTDGIGSYDAIRVYLWIGMLDAADPDRRELLERYAPVAGSFGPDGRPPERIDVATARARGAGPGGFSASFVPFFAALGDFGAVAQQKVHLAAQTATDAKRYYDGVLRLWSEGWESGRYRFAPDGSLLAAWPRCTSVASEGSRR